MKVWVLFEVWDFEGSAVNGVYATEALAEAAAAAKPPSSLSHHEIESFEVVAE